MQGRCWVYGPAAGRVLGLAVLLAVALVAPSAALAAAKVHEHGHHGKPDLDTRTGSVAPTASQRAAAADVAASVRWTRFGTAKSAVRRDGKALGRSDEPSPAAAARDWVARHKELFRLPSADGLRVDTATELGASGGHAVIFRQTVGGLDVAPEGQLTVALRPAAGGFDVVYASSSVTGETTLDGTASLSPAAGWAHAAADAGMDVSLAQVRERGDRNGWTELEVAGNAMPQLVRLVAFPTADATVPAYETYVLGSEDGIVEGYWTFVDARTGAVLLRESAVDHAVDNPRWKVFEANPLTALDEFPWNYPSADVRELWCWLKEPLCQYLPSQNVGSRGIPWDQLPPAMTPTFTTTGNNAHSQENWELAFAPEPASYQPVSPTRDYVYPWTNAWFETRCDPANFVPGVGNDIDAATANLFAMHNRMHDWSYVLGFREETWNAQQHNFGVNPAGEGDPIRGLVQAGAVTGGWPNYSGRDNAYMATAPDGTPSYSGMFLWQPLAGAFYAPCVDGDYDMSVIGHEYGHMIENRMIGKGVRRQGFHAGAMGESFGDFVAMEYLNEYNFVPAGGGDNPVRDASVSLIGRYVTGNDERGIRNYDMGFPTAGEYPLPGKYPHVNPLNFSDVGYDIVGPQVHADGEIWSATQFDIRENLLDRYPGLGQEIQRDCADGHRPPEACPGNRRWIQLYFDAMLLMPIAPTFLDARDAMLAADVLRFGGANQDLLWLAFARRGFGQEAVTTGPQDSEPIPSWESPLHEEATVTFNAFAQDEGNAPIANARFYVGHYEARVSPVADTNPATVGPNLDNVERFVPEGPPGNTGAHQRVYEFVVHAEGYGHVRFTIPELKPGEARVVNVYMPTNWASQHKGAVATGDGENHDRLIDDTEGTNWQSIGAPAQGRQVLVQLAGGPHRVDHVNVSAMLVPGQNRFTALRQFEVLGCSPARGSGGNTTIDGAAFQCTPIVRSQHDAFPGVPPRPTGPDLVLRSWQAGGGAGTTHVLFRVLDNQCTGQPAFHGEQDNDPLNTSTDCRIGTAPTLPPRDAEVRAAELQVFSSSPRVDGATNPR